MLTFDFLRRSFPVLPDDLRPGTCSCMADEIFKVRYVSKSKSNRAPPTGSAATEALLDAWVEAKRNKDFQAADDIRQQFWGDRFAMNWS